MKNFKYIEDIEAWIEPMDYQHFWFAVQPYNLVLQPRDHCDQQIASGEIDETTVLNVLKYFVRLELAEKLGLHQREVTPWLKLVK